MKNDLERLKNKNLPCANCKTLKAIEVIKECFDFNGFDELVPNAKWWENEDKQKILKNFILMLYEKTFDKFLNETQERRTRIKRYRYTCGIDLNKAFNKAVNEAFNKAINEAIEEIKKRNLKQ